MTINDRFAAFLCNGQREVGLTHGMGLSLRITIHDLRFTIYDLRSSYESAHHR
ncbi:MAG: hypothetical protein ACRD6N_20695 [Pyrinomonadaceae bacterium]